jgi:hypothetical protein
VERVCVVGVPFALALLHTVSAAARRLLLELAGDVAGWRLLVLAVVIVWCPKPQVDAGGCPVAVEAPDVPQGRRGRTQHENKQGLPSTPISSAATSRGSCAGSRPSRRKRHPTNNRHRHPLFTCRLVRPSASMSVSNTKTQSGTSPRCATALDIIVAAPHAG